MSQNSPTGLNRLHNPLYNKDLAFTQAERDQYHLNGLLSYHQASLKEQCERAYQQLQAQEKDLEKHIFLRGLQDTNEVLFYTLLTQHLEEIMPLVYTPVVGAGCLHFSHIYRHPRGIFVSYPLRHQMDQLFQSVDAKNVRVIVVTDGERILGLGDQGANGMGIPIGKLSLYTACAGIHPAQTLPITLDVGTNNPQHLEDPLYIGWHHERIRGEAYNQFIEQFVQTIQKHFPHVVLQWEDFAQQNANPILATYRDQLCTFNDDIQGTAAVAVGTLLAAIKITGTPLSEQRIAVCGAGSAGCGISSLILEAMLEQGMTAEAAKACFFLVDREGLLREEQDHLQPFQRPFAKTAASLHTWSCADPTHITLAEVIHHAQPTVLIGVSGVPGAFSEALIKDMARHVKHPIIFPLSNPTSKAEATPSDLLHWTEQRAIIGTGSPFAPVTQKGRTFTITQTNNAYIFPGLGLGLSAARATRVTDKMFMIAAKTLAEAASAQHAGDGSLLPPLRDIRALSQKIAENIALEALAEGFTPLKTPEAIKQAIQELIWTPAYE